LQVVLLKALQVLRLALGLQQAQMLTHHLWTDTRPLLIPQHQQLTQPLMHAASTVSIHPRAQHWQLKQLAPVRPTAPL